MVMDVEELMKFFSEFWDIDESEIDNDLILNDENLENHSSVRFYQFIAALESNFDVVVKNFEDIFTFGDLIKNIVSKK
jgi:hypothetical protein